MTTAIPLCKQRLPSLSYSSDEGDSCYDLSSSSLSSSVVSDRRDSLPTHFNALTFQAYSTSLPENYTIDHGSLQQQQQQKQQQQKQQQRHRHRRSSAIAAAAITGGQTLRPPVGLQHHSCGACGKVYKHPSCLAKHRWEHSEQWEITSKLLLTKHQQVQMLEAAAILVSMDRDSQRRSQNEEPSSTQQDEEAFWIDI